MKINQTEVNFIMTDLMQYINQIDQSVADAEIDVLESLIQSYDKSIMIITEASDDTDLSAFDIFQEGETWDKFKEDTKAPVLGNKGEGIVKRILMIIPRLIQKLIAMIRKLFTKNKSFEQKMDKDVDNLKKQAQTVVPEQLSEEQAKNLANKINEATKASSQAVAQSERDFKSKRDAVKDSIGKRHEQLREYIRDSEKTFQSKMDDLHSYAKSIDDPFGNSKALKELGKMINDDGPVFKSITPEMVEKIDKKNPGLIDDLLEEVGDSPRKKQELSKQYFTIKNTSFFDFDKSHEEFSSLPYTHFVFSFNIDIRIIRDICDDVPDQKDYAKIAEFCNKLEKEMIPTIEDSITRISATYSSEGTVKVRYNDIVKVVEHMKSEINKILTEINGCIDNIEKIQPGIKKQVEQLNNDGMDGNIFYHVYDKNIRILNQFERGLIAAVDHLTEYRNAIQSIWDRHITLIDKTIKSGGNKVEFRVADTYYPNVYLK